VIGVGNRHGGDDAVGPCVLRRLRAASVAAGVGLRDVGGDTVAMLDAWRGASAAIVIDAARSRARPGTIHRIEVGQAPLPAALRRGSSTHALGVAEAIELARAIRRLPDRVIVYGVEGERFAAGAGLSPSVAAAAAELATLVLREAGELARGY
jgi:hydrogenase maturation protease